MKQTFPAPLRESIPHNDLKSSPVGPVWNVKAEECISFEPPDVEKDVLYTSFEKLAPSKVNFLHNDFCKFNRGALNLLCELDSK